MLREWLIGPPLPTQRAGDERLSKRQALAAFSPDALASIAYANQEIFLGLVVAGAAGLAWSWPIALSITAVLVIVGLSYYQTIQAYPQGGGSYTVARENLGTTTGLIAAAALMIDYLLNAAVSATAGIAALTSAFPALAPYRVGLALLLLAVITVLNLRGVRESGKALALPVYGFVGTYLLLIVVGLVRMRFEPAGNLSIVAPPPTQALTLMVIWHAFAAGCTALTGVEAISNGVPAFRPPEARQASITLLVMVGLMGILFSGTVGLTQYFAVIPTAHETILSALARRLFGDGGPYYLVQVVTLAMLAIATNTSFAGFPRLTSILAQDGYLPRQLTFLGDRLVYSNGILMLSILSMALVVLFDGDTHALVPLFAVGAFMAFTLSQAGMVRHWWRARQRGWWASLLMNAAGMFMTGAALFLVIVAKFVHGAWIVLFLIPLQVLMFRTIKSHYIEIGRELTLHGLPPDIRPLPVPRIVIPISGVHRGVIEAVRYARAISNKVTVVYVEVMPGGAEKVCRAWEKWEPDIPLVVLPSPYRSTLGPFLEFLDHTDAEHNDGQLATVLLPEFIPARWWQMPLHNQTAWLFKMALLYRRRRYGRGRAIIDVPFFLRR